MEQLDQAFAVGMQEAEVACTSEASGQHMLQDQPKELGTGDGTGFHLLGLGLLITEGHLSILADQDVFFLNDTPIEIAPEIDQCLFTAPDRLAINDPFFGVTLGQRESLMDDCVEHFGAEDLGQGLVIEEVNLAGLLGFWFGSPQPLLAIHSGSRHDQMHMGMIVEPTRMGMQDRNGARHALQPLVVMTEAAHGLPDTADHPIIEGALVLPGQGPELGRQGEGQQKILGRDLLLELTLQPLLAFMVLAMRAVAMTTGVRHQDLMVTGGALHLHAWTQRSATSLHGLQSAALPWQE